MNLSEMIAKRSSCRSYCGEPLDAQTLERIRSFEMKPLYPQCRVHWQIVERDQIRCICPWSSPQLIAIYSEEKDGYLENVGFLFQQMDLYLQSLGLGACWLGMGRLRAGAVPAVEGMRFVILLAFGRPRTAFLRGNAAEFKRKRMDQITDRPDKRLEPARLAPSSINSQPWFFVHEGDTIHTFCTRKSVARHMNRIDVGIALAHLYTANPESFCFFRAQQLPELQGCTYIGSVTI